ncbi:MAG: sugar ABC transporter permease [Clostridia bacterium]|nr:sugar ABC transporter permease [Clostridia bacterium]MBP3360089.1 sugar ABC transporter permease [Clostridia bacterium]
MKLHNNQTAALSKRNKTIGTIIRDMGAWVLILPTLLILYFFVLRPIIVGAWYSLHEMQGFTIKEFVGLENYTRILADTQFPRVLWNTVQYVLWSFIIGFVPPIILAIMMNEMVHLKGWFKFSTYFPCIVPMVAATMLWFYMYLPNESGLLNTLLAHFGIEPFEWLQNDKFTIPLIMITCTWKGSGGSVIIYLASLQGVNQELYEATVIDGAGFLRRIRTIAIPHLSGIILLNAVRQIIGIFQIMAEPMTMTDGGPNGASMSIALWAYKTAFIDFNAATSLSIGVITFFLLVIFTVFYFAVQNKVQTD